MDMIAEDKREHAVLMDGVYRYQRHIYDLTRKYFLLGRDHLIDNLDPAPGGSVLELGCGTGRNLQIAMRRHPRCRFFGLDISEAMLETAHTKLAGSTAGRGVRLAAGDASEFDVQALFGEPGMDRIFISYSLSMIPPWEQTIEAALGALNAGGSLHIVDFGDQAGLPRSFRAVLLGWLRRFHVAPRTVMPEVADRIAREHGADFTFETLYRGYAWHLVIRKRPHSG